MCTVNVYQKTRVVDPQDKAGWVITLEPGDNVIQEKYLAGCLAAGARPVTEVPQDIVDDQNAQKEEEFNRELLISVLEDMILVNDLSNFTKFGRPRIEAVRKRVEFKITADEMNEAYEEALNRTNNGSTDTGHSDEGIDHSGGHTE